MPRLDFAEGGLREKIREAQSDPHFSRAKLRRLEFFFSNEQLQKRGYLLYFLSKEGSDKGFLFSRPKIAYDLSELEQKKIDYVFIARTSKDYQPPSFYEALKKKGRLVKRFSPYRDKEREYPLDSQPLTGGPFLWKELISRERNGQPVEVYQLG